MAKNPSGNNVPVLNQKEAPAAGKKPPLVPPEERFWERYSPHYEFPLSSVASVTLHVLAGVFILFVLAKYLARLNEAQPLPIGMVQFDEGGGGGDEGGAGAGPGTGAKPEAVEQPADTPPDPKMAAVDLDKLPPKEKVDPSLFPELANDAEGQRLIKDGSRSAAALAKMEKGIRDKLVQGLGGKGKGGTGSGGGKGTGTGSGAGPNAGPGGNLNQRQKRQLRWTMIFNTRDGHDYLRQLDSLGAIIGVEEPGGLRVYRKLRQRPARGEIEDVSQIQRIFWIDANAESVAGIVQAMQLPGIPPRIIAFLPEKLEKELLAKELNFAKRKENEIKETIFEVVSDRRGGYTTRVIKQS